MEGEGTKRALEDMVFLALKNWPETIMPNKFIGVLYDLSLKFYQEGTLKGIAFMKELASDVSFYFFYIFKEENEKNLKPQSHAE